MWSPARASSHGPLLAASKQALLVGDVVPSYCEGEKILQPELLSRRVQINLDGAGLPNVAAGAVTGNQVTTPNGEFGAIFFGTIVQRSCPRRISNLPS